MDNKIERIFRVYTELDTESRKLLRERINNFENVDYSKKREIREGFNKSLGPLMTNTCEYCGK